MSFSRLFRAPDFYRITDESAGGSGSEQKPNEPKTPNAATTPDAGQSVDRLSVITNEIATLRQAMEAERTARTAAEQKVNDLVTAQKQEKGNAAIYAAAAARNAYNAKTVAKVLGEVETEADGTPKADALKAALDKLQQDSPELFKPSHLSGDAGASGSGNHTATLDAQIAEAEKKGDIKALLALKLQKSKVSA